MVAIETFYGQVTLFHPDQPEMLCALLDHGKCGIGAITFAKDKPIYHFTSMIRQKICEEFTLDELASLLLAYDSVLEH